MKTTFRIKIEIVLLIIVLLSLSLGLIGVFNRAIDSFDKAVEVYERRQMAHTAVELEKTMFLQQHSERYDYEDCVANSYIGWIKNCERYKK